MSDFDTMWANADPDAVGSADNIPPEPGTYFGCTLIDASAWVKAETGQSWMRMKWRLNDSSNHEWGVLYGFKSQGQANVAKSAARAVGVDIDNVLNLQQLDEALGLACGNYFDLDVVQNGEYRNTYIRGASQEAHAPVTLDEAVTSGAIQTEQIPADDIPF